MNCQRCNKPQIVTITAKCSDCCFVDYPDGREHQGYVPNDLGPIGSGDYVEMAYCLNCGQIQGTFPVAP